MLTLVQHIDKRSEGTSGVSQWYIQFWLPQISNEALHAQMAIYSCDLLRQSLLKAGQPSLLPGFSTLQSLCEKIHAYLTDLLDFGSPIRLIEGNECKLDDDTTFHIPRAVMTLNGLVQSCNVSSTMY